MWYTEPSKPLNLQKVQESPIRGGIIEESINDTHKWEAERMARNILVVEDDRNISDLIRMYLEKEGFEVRSAMTAARPWRNSTSRPRTWCCWISCCR